MKPSFQRNRRQIYCHIWQQDTSTRAYATWYSTPSHLISCLHLYLLHSLRKSLQEKSSSPLLPTDSSASLSIWINHSRKNRITDAFYVILALCYLFIYFFRSDWVIMAAWEKTSSGTLPGVVLPWREYSRKYPMMFLFHFKSIKASCKSGRART